MTDLLSKLKIGDKIDEGFFNPVHIGEDPVHGPVAIKILRQRPGESDDDWEVHKKELLGEGQRLKQARHDHVVPVYHLLEAATDDEVLLVMEYCEGGSLQKAFETGPMKLSAARQAVTDTALGLQALHARNMLHRDIKPGNLLRDRRGRVKLGDFGLVTDRVLLGYGSAAGYSDHLAPEVWAEERTSAASDIWALGMTAYRLLHGLDWYSRSPAPRSLIEGGGFADTLRWLPHVAKPWRRFIRKMMRDDPNERYRGAGNVIDAVGQLPIDPDWTCTVAGDEVQWRRATKSRVVRVVWNGTGPKRNEWEAWSEPRSTGRRRTLGGSTGLTYNQAIKELEQFFSSQS